MRSKVASSCNNQHCLPLLLLLSDTNYQNSLTTNLCTAGRQICQNSLSKYNKCQSKTCQVHRLGIGTSYVEENTVVCCVFVPKLSLPLQKKAFYGVEPSFSSIYHFSIIKGTKITGQQEFSLVAFSSSAIFLPLGVIGVEKFSIILGTW